MASIIEADYLVIGAGAMGLAFVDTLLSENDSARVVIVDRYARPGGHWTVAYPFVRLHQPSTGYGVESRRLGDDAIDRVGWNAGLLELASVDAVCAYFDLVMREQFLPSGRVDYRPMTDHLGDGRFRSLVTGAVSSVGPDCRIVDATYQNVAVPAMRPPPYAVADGVRCIPPNGLVGMREPVDRFTVIGAGKTGMDACLWLLAQGVEPDQIRWVMPRDSWVIDRAVAQPGPAFAEAIVPIFVGQLEAVQAAASIDDLFERLEACGRLIRLDPSVRPTMYRCATVSQAELVQLRRIRDVVRLGRVVQIAPDRLVLEQGAIAASGSTLYVDCTADGLAAMPPAPVFDGRFIRLQSVRTCQQVFSAAMIAHVEANHADDAVKNRLCRPIPHPDTEQDFFRTTVADVRNEAAWSEDARLQAWLATSRLNWVRDVGPQLPAEAGQRAAAIAVRRSVMAAMADKIEALAAAHGPT